MNTKTMKKINHLNAAQRKEALAFIEEFRETLEEHGDLDVALFVATVLQEDLAELHKKVNEPIYNP